MVSVDGSALKDIDFAAVIAGDVGIASATVEPSTDVVGDLDLSMDTMGDAGMSVPVGVGASASSVVVVDASVVAGAMSGLAVSDAVTVGRVVPISVVAEDPKVDVEPTKAVGEAPQ